MVFALLLLGTLSLVGCGNEAAGPKTSDYDAAKPKILAAASARQNAGPPRPAAPAPAAEETGAQATVTAGYRYNPTEKRDPFRSFILDQAKEAAAKDVGPLEQFDISQLAVVAVVWDTGMPVALVADPSGRPYLVAEGASVGKNDGRVIKIGDGMVLVKETYVDWLGEKTTKDIEMSLAGGDKGGDLR
jgi:type IV pilus assembly protein PilP